MTDLFKAVKTRDAKRVQELLQDPAVASSVNTLHPTKKLSPLMRACKSSPSKEIIRSLLNAGADPNLTDESRHRNTALHYACRCNAMEAIEALLDGGASPFVLNAKGHSPTDAARLVGLWQAATAASRPTFCYGAWVTIRYGRLLYSWKRRWCALHRTQMADMPYELIVYTGPSQGPIKDLVFIPSDAKLLKEEVESEDARKSRPVASFSRPAVWINPMDQHFSRDSTVTQRGSSKDFVFAVETIPDLREWLEAMRAAGQAAAPLASIVQTTNQEDPPMVSITSNGPKSGADMSNQSPQPSAPLAEAVHSSSMGNVRQQAQRSARPPRATSSAPEVLTTASVPRQVPPRGECVVCLDAMRNAICLPCGHIAGCYTCLTALSGHHEKSCPICRQRLESVARVYDC